MFELRKISFAIFYQIIVIQQWTKSKSLLRLVKSAQTGKVFHRLTTLLLQKTFSNAINAALPMPNYDTICDPAD